MAKDSNKSKDPTEKVAESKSSGKKLKKEPSKIKRFFKYFFLTVLITCLLIGVIVVGYVVAVMKSAPPLDVSTINNLNQPSVLLTPEGNLIDNIPSEEIRYPISSYEEIPQNLIDAYVSIEDERFWEHGGIDIKRIISAAARDVLVVLGKKSGLHGASTITQQLIKNTILFQEASSENQEGSSKLARVNRKIKEIYLAVQLNKKVSKEQIIRSYLNTIPLGGHNYGVEAAADYYFAKDAKDLTLVECAYIAGITQAPTTYSAYNTSANNYPNGYINRTKTVLEKMLELGYISQAEFDEAFAIADTNAFQFSKVDNDFKVNHESFVYPAIDQVKKDLKEKYKYTDEEINKLLVNGGLKIYTTLDTEMQDTVQAILDDNANMNAKAKDKYGISANAVDDSGVPLLQAAATIMDYRTGEVKVIIGGRGDQPASSRNRAYFDLKSIGSTTKPLTIYGPAIDTKVITLGTPLDDVAIQKDMLKKYNFGSTNPKNADGSMAGFVTARDALVKSKNLTSIRTVDMIGLDTALEYGERAGIKYAPESHTMSALALGEFYQPAGNRDGGNTTILASAYGAIGNNGVRIEPILYTKVVDATGTVILEKKPQTTQMFSAQTAYILYDVLKGAASSVQFGDIPLAGKTGTTEGAKNYWFAGLTPYYSGSVWIGYDDPKEMTGGSTNSAGNLFKKVMSAVHNGLGYKDIEKPSGLVKKSVCMDSGKIPTDLCSHDQRGSRVRTEYFIEGTQPKSVCDVHVKVAVNNENNKLANDNTPPNLLAEKIFIKKPHANPNAADFPFVVPTEEDDTKPVEIINIFQIGLRKNMDLYDAIVILNNRQIKYNFDGVSVSGQISPRQYTLLDFTPEIKEGDTVVLKVKATTSGDGEDVNNDDDDDDEDDDDYVVDPASYTDIGNIIDNIINIFN